MKVFVKRYPSKGELPETAGYYDTNAGRVFYVNEKFDRPKKYYPIWWLEEIEIPSEEEMFNHATTVECKEGEELDAFRDGANFILNLLKQK